MRQCIIKNRSDQSRLESQLVKFCASGSTASPTVLWTPTYFTTSARALTFFELLLHVSAPHIMRSDARLEYITGSKIEWLSVIYNSLQNLRSESMYEEGFELTLVNDGNGDPKLRPVAKVVTEYIHNVYAPNMPNEKKAFFESLPTDSEPDAHHTVCGDFNTAIGIDVDSARHARHNDMSQGELLA